MATFRIIHYYTFEFTNGKGFPESFRFQYQTNEPLSPTLYATIPFAGGIYKGTLKFSER